MIELHHGDCLEVMAGMEAESVDAVIADPPFGIGFKYNSHDDSPTGYGDWIWNRIEMAENKCASGAPLFVWQAMPNIRCLTKWFPRNWRIFAAAKSFVQIRPGCPMQYSFDPVLVWWKPGDIWFAGTAGGRDFHLANTSPSGQKKLGDYVKGHPCPRPLSQVRHIVEQWVRPGDTVLDPFMGSGTTGVACVQTGRNFIGIEIDKNYFDIAQVRIEKAQTEMLQLRLDLPDPDSWIELAFDEWLEEPTQ